MRQNRHRIALSTLIVAALASACIDTPVTQCADGRLCPPGTVCDETRGGCVLPEQAASCEGMPDLSVCSYPNVMDGACYDGICLPAGCGNGILDTGEACDDGNQLHGDGCSADCRSDETCGNNVIDLPVGESCDDGNTADGDGCRANCVAISCGDGIVDGEAFEQCDQGSDNSDQPDAACRLNCQPRRCGDGITDPVDGEECDDGNLEPGDGCAGTCRWEVCGNGAIDLEPEGPGYVPTEECDDGNQMSLDGCASDCRRVEGSWETNSAPTARNTNVMAYDAARRRMVMFGGYRLEYESDTWEWDGVSWIDQTPPDEADSPSARGSHAMVFDAARGRVMLFGGFSDGHESNTFEWNGTRWEDRTPPSPAISPPKRSRHAMAYDHRRGRVVLFGGTGAGRLGDTWEWDGTEWHDTTPATALPAPSPRAGHRMVYDARRGVVVLFGGFDGSMSPETWQWDGVAWTDVTPVGPNTSPPGRMDHGLVYDRRSEQVIAFGGQGALTLRDTWAWNGTTWTELTPPVDSDSPSPRALFSMAYDIHRERTVLFGGTAITTLAETWEWDGSRWIEVSPDPERPSARASHAMSYVSRRGEVVMFGGAAFSPNAETWVWRNNRWTDVTPGTPSASPPPLEQHAMAYDAGRDRLVLFGGRTPSFSANTWEWDGTRWYNRTPSTTSPSPRYHHRMAYDAARGRIILFGGNDGTLRSDTWSWDGTAWTDVSPTNPADSPVARFRHTMSYDHARQRIVLFGGFSNLLQRDTWEWDGTRWIDRTPAADGDSPPARFGHAAAYDAVLRRVVLFGGSDGSIDLADTWEWMGDKWTRVTSPQGLAAPQTRLATAMAYDATSGRIVMFGGHDGTDFVSETWRYAHRRSGPESCHSGLDDDSDGNMACDDPDCWGYCTPQCPPGAPCAGDEPRCGDNTCNAALESCRLCPADCGPCPGVCGDFVCDASETAATCPGDC